MKNRKIDKSITIEELLAVKPASVSYLMEHGIKCIACGEPVWGTLESVSKSKGFSNNDIDRFVEELNQI